MDECLGYDAVSVITGCTFMRSCLLVMSYLCHTYTVYVAYAICRFGRLGMAADLRCSARVISQPILANLIWRLCSFGEEQMLEKEEGRWLARGRTGCVTGSCDPLT